jgi:hypothetical protein
MVLVRLGASLIRGELVRRAEANNLPLAGPGPVSVGEGDGAARQAAGLKPLQLVVGDRPLNKAIMPAPSALLAFSLIDQKLEQLTEFNS